MKRILLAYLMLSVLLLTCACSGNPDPTPTEPPTVVQNNPTDVLPTELTDKQEEESKPDTTKHTLTVEVPSHWTTVYVYTWDPEAFGTFPGSPMMKESDNTYKYQLPDNVTNIIISNQDRAQTADLKVTSGVDVKMVIDSESKAMITYPNGGGTVIQPPDDVPVGELSSYRVVGSADWMGNWDAAFEDGRMTKVGDGLYRKEFKDVPAGSYELKITKDGKWDNCYGDGNGQNFKFTIGETTDLTVDFKLIDGRGIISIPNLCSSLDGD